MEKSLSQESEFLLPVNRKLLQEKFCADKRKGPVCAVPWSPDGSKLCTGSLDSTVLVWQLGGTVLDWAVSAVCAGHDSDALEALLSLDEYSNLEGKCDKNLLLELCCAASKVKKFQPEKYKKLCEVIAMIANKPGAPL